MACHNRRVTVSERLIALDEKIDEQHREHQRFWSQAARSADDLHVFNQQFLLRSDEIHRRHITILDQILAESRAGREETRAGFEDALAAARAQREALFRILDELKRDDPPTPD